MHRRRGEHGLGAAGRTGSGLAQREVVTDRSAEAEERGGGACRHGDGGGPAPRPGHLPAGVERIDHGRDVRGGLALRRYRGRQHLGRAREHALQDLPGERRVGAGRGVARQEAGDEAGERAGMLRCRGILGQDGGEGRERRVPPERRPPLDGGVQGRPERPESLAGEGASPRARSGAM